MKGNDVMLTKQSLFEKALNSPMHSRFVSRSETLNRSLTDNETREEAKYLIETIPFSGLEEEVLEQALMELKKLTREL